MIKTFRNILISGLIVSFFTVSGFLVYQYSADENESENLLFVEVFDVGQGSSAFIETPYGHRILIDGGPDDSVVNKLDAYMPFFDQRLDLVILSHPHADHLSGIIDILKKYTIDNVWHTGVIFTTDIYSSFLETLIKLAIPNEIIEGVSQVELVFDELDTKEPVILNVLYPIESFNNKKVENINNTSIVVQVVYNDIEFLFMGDLEMEVEEDLINFHGSNLKSDVMVIGHHGSQYSTSNELLDLVNPEIVIISVGKDNDYGHPSFFTLNKLEQKGIKVLRTDLIGDILFQSNGNEISLVEN